MDITELDSFNLSDAIKFHSKLNPKLWHKHVLDGEVKEQLLLIAKDFVSFLGLTDLKVKDVTISGSNAAYSYTPHSDIDLHIVVDFRQLPNNEVYQELFTAKKTLYNDSLDITVRGIPVECYVQDSNEPVVSLGEYSLLHDRWLKAPKRTRANFDQDSTRHKYESLNDFIELALKTKSLDRINKAISTVRRYRQAGLDKGGEFSPENLAYKAIRTQGGINALYDLRSKLESEKLSLDEATSREDAILKINKLRNTSGRTKEEINTITTIIDRMMKLWNIHPNELQNEVDPLQSKIDRAAQEKQMAASALKGEWDRLKGKFKNIFSEETDQLTETTEESQVINLVANKAGSVIAKMASRNTSMLGKVANVLGPDMKQLKLGVYGITAAELGVPETNDPVLSKILKTLKFILDYKADRFERGTVGAYNFYANEIHLYYPALVKFAKRKGYSLDRYIAKTIAHELLHALDYNKSKGKAFRPTGAYATLPYEINARFQEALYNISLTLSDIKKNDRVFSKTRLYELINVTLDHNRIAEFLPKDGKRYKRLVTRAYKFFEAEMNSPKVEKPLNIVQRAMNYILDKPTTQVAESPDHILSKEKLTEWMDSPYPYNKLKQHNDWKLEYEFTTKEGNLYDVAVAMHRKDIAVVNFNMVKQDTGAGTEKLTGTGDSIKVLSTVVNIVKDAVSILNPKYIMFEASTSEPSRVKLYATMGRMAAKALPNYKLKSIKTSDENSLKKGPGSYSVTTLVRTGPVNEISRQLDEIGFSNAMGPLSLTDEQIISNSVKDGTIGSRPVFLFASGPNNIYFFANDSKIEAFVYLQAGCLKGMKNISQFNKGLVFNLFQYIINLKGQEIHLGKTDNLTPDGITWLLNQTKRDTTGFKLRDQTGALIDPGALFKEWENARETFVPGPTSITISESLHSSQMLENEKSLMPMDIYGATLSEIIPHRHSVVDVPDLIEASGYIPSEKEKSDPRFKTALTKDVRPDSIKKNAKAFNWKTSRAGIPPQARADGKIAENLMKEWKSFLAEDEQLPEWKFKKCTLKESELRRFFEQEAIDRRQTYGTRIVNHLGDNLAWLERVDENTVSPKIKELLDFQNAITRYDQRSKVKPEVGNTLSIVQVRPHTAENIIELRGFLNPKTITDVVYDNEYIAWLEFDDGSSFPDKTLYKMGRGNDFERLVTLMFPDKATADGALAFIYIQKPEGWEIGRASLGENASSQSDAFFFGKSKTSTLKEDQEQQELFPGYDKEHREKRLDNWLQHTHAWDGHKPRVFYHATTKDFDSFQTSGKGFTSVLGMTFDVERHGSFFAVDPKFAETFIEDPNTREYKPGGRIIPVYLSVQNPIDLRDYSLSRMLSNEETVEGFKQNNIDLRSIYYYVDQFVRWELFDGPEGAEFVENLQKLGFDGAIIAEAIPNDCNAKSGEVWVIFNPNQVKAIHNRGSFSPNDPNMMKETG